MTACTNHGGKARRVVTAALVGVLSVGTVPMVALAEGVNDGISTLALSSSEAFQLGKMTAAEDAKGRKLDIPSDGVVTVSEGNWVVPTEVTPKDGKPVDIRTDANKDAAHPKNASISYSGVGFSGSKWASQVTSADFQTPGKYTATITLDDDSTAKLSVDFFVEEAKDLSDAVIYDNSNGAKNVDDTTFTYKGSEYDKAEIGVAIDGKALTYGKDYAIAKGSETLTDAGTYVITIGGRGDYLGQTKQVTLTIDKVDLSSANVTVGDKELRSFAGTLSSFNADNVTYAVESDVDAKVTYTKNETGKASVSIVASDNAANFTGSATVEFSIVDSLVTNASYNGSAFSSYPADDNGVPTVDINLADGESFKPERIQVPGLDASYYNVSYTDANGETVDASALSQAGVYYAIVRVDAEASRFQYGSDDITLKVNVRSAEVSDSDVVFKFDGNIGDYFDPTYDGTDMLERLETVVHTKWGDDLVEGTDYTVQAYKGDEKVDAVVDAGEYTVKIELKGNYGSGLDLECTIDVQKMEVSSVFARGGIVTEYTPSASAYPVYYVSYTGSEIEPSFELGYYTDSDGECTNTVSGSTWHALPADSYEVTGYSYKAKPADAATDADALKDKGYYLVEFAFDGGNYDVSVDSTYNWLQVSDASVGFLDVDSNAWYAQAVYQAKQLGYVFGVSGSNFFAPEAKITRADALVIISRMSGFDAAYADDEDYLEENSGYVTRYTDVDPGAYYAKAIAWGTKMGIVSGYQDGSGKFGPTDSITREQFAAMLSNYAKATGDKTVGSADESVLDGYADASSVSSWATDAVAWAVENEVMGNNGALMGQNTITRGEVAAMAVNYQPEGISSEVIA